MKNQSSLDEIKFQTNEMPLNISPLKTMLIKFNSMIPVKFNLTTSD